MGAGLKQVRLVLLRLRPITTIGKTPTLLLVQRVKE